MKIKKIKKPKTLKYPKKKKAPKRPPVSASEEVQKRWADKVVEVKKINDDNIKNTDKKNAELMNAYKKAIKDQVDSKKRAEAYRKKGEATLAGMSGKSSSRKRR